MRPMRRLNNILVAAAQYFLLLSAHARVASAQNTAINQAQSLCYDLQPFKVSAFSLWHVDFPAAAQQRINNAQSICESELPASELPEFRIALSRYRQLRHFEMIFSLIALHVDEHNELAPEKLAALQTYCSEAVNVCSPNPLDVVRFEYSPALDHILNWLYSRDLWRVREVVMFFEIGMRNFEKDFDKWQNIAESKRHSGIYLFAHALKLRNVEEAWRKSVLQPWVVNLRNLPSNLDSLPCKHIYLTRLPIVTPRAASPFYEFGDLSPTLMEVLQRHNAAVCASHFAKPEDFATVVKWDASQYLLTILENLYAASVRVVTGRDSIELMDAVAEQLHRWIKNNSFQFQPLGMSIDYLIGLLASRGHLTKKVRAMLNLGMQNYADSAGWMLLAQEMHWHNIVDLLKTNSPPQPAVNTTYTLKRFEKHLKPPAKVGEERFVYNGTSLRLFAVGAGAGDVTLSPVFTL